jgi:DNA-binding HxlR family transcriptional regulator
VIEIGICSAGRLRIIAALANPELKPLSKYQLEKKTGIRSSSLISDLRKLQEIGWVVQIKEGERRTLYTLNRENELLKKVLLFLDSVSYLR